MPPGLHGTPTTIGRSIPRGHSIPHKTGKPRPQCGQVHMAERYHNTITTVSQMAPNVSQFGLKTLAGRESRHLDATTSQHGPLPSLHLRGEDVRRVSSRPPTRRITPAAAWSQTADFFSSQYSRLSAKASQLASIIFSELPTVLHWCWPSPDSINTRTCDSVPALSSRMRTL